MSKDLEKASLRLQGKLLKLSDDTDKEMKKAVIDSVLKIHSDAVRSIQKVSQGERQTRYNPKREVVVSRPMDPPNTDTGRLIQSIEFEVDGKTGYVGTNLRYGAYLEFGTNTMAPRPWLFPAFLKNRKEVKEIMFDGVQVSLDKAVKP
jgi:HK97 gp10 family phage protein